MHTRAKLVSMSDLNGRDEATLTLIRADNERYAVTLSPGDLVFWSARIAAVMTKKADEDANGLAARQPG